MERKIVVHHAQTTTTPVNQVLRTFMEYFVYVREDHLAGKIEPRQQQRITTGLRGGKKSTKNTFSNMRIV